MHDPAFEATRPTPRDNGTVAAHGAARVRPENPSSTARLTRRGFATLATATATLGLAACTDAIKFGKESEPAAPAPEAAGTAFAQALSTGDLSQVPVRGATPAQATLQVKEALGDLAEHKPTVTFTDITPVDSITVTGNFTVTWELKPLLPAAAQATQEPTTWTYPTKTDFVFVNGKWTANWNIATLAPALNGSNKLTIALDGATRGPILGGNDQPIVQERDVYEVGLDKTQVSAAEQEASARALAAVVDVNADAYAKQVAAAGPKQFVVAITLRKEAIPDLLQRLGAIKGAFAPAKKLDLAPSSRFATQILGKVGEATAEMIEKSNGALQPGDYTGLSGLQLEYNDTLQGKPGLRVVVVDNPDATALPTPATAPGNGAGTATTTATPTESATPTAGKPINRPTDLFTIKGGGGNPLKTTLNEFLQTLCENALIRFADTPSAIVVIQPSTGHILAAATGPGSPGFSTATLGQYAPGSTFKVASALAALRKGKTLESVVACPPTVTVDGRQFKNDDGYPAAQLGNQPLLNVIKYSCNTGFVNLGTSVPQADLVTAAATLGMGQPNDTGIPAFLGSVPASATPTEHAASMFGQGKVLASPLTMATVAASVARGALVKPVFVREQPTGGDASASPAASASKASSAAAPLAPAEKQALDTAMQAVVQGGTAAILRDVPAPVVGAKTGTAQYGNDNPPKVHAWMIAYHGDFAACVFVEDGDYGATTAGPVMQTLLKTAPGVLGATPAPPTPSSSAPSSSAPVPPSSSAPAPPKESVAPVPSVPTTPAT